MQLTMTAEIDLPDAPEGYSWRLSAVGAGSVSVWLQRDGELAGLVSEMEVFEGRNSRWVTLNGPSTVDYTALPVRDAAVALFAALGLEAK